MKTLLFLAAVFTAALAPAKQFPFFMPPAEQRALPEGGSFVLTLYLPSDKVQDACVSLGNIPKPTPGVSILGCTMPNDWGGFTILPNPCDAADESYAALACHENAHAIYGWVHR